MSLHRFFRYLFLLVIIYTLLNIIIKDDALAYRAVWRQAIPHLAPNAKQGEGKAIVVDPGEGGYVYLTGTWAPNNFDDEHYDWYIQKRSKEPNTSTDPPSSNLIGQPYILDDPWDDDDDESGDWPSIIYGMTHDDLYLYVVGVLHGSDDREWRVERISKATMTRPAINGFATENPDGRNWSSIKSDLESSGNGSDIYSYPDKPIAIAISGNDLYIVGTDSVNMNTSDPYDGYTALRIEKRDKSNLSRTWFTRHANFQQGPPWQDNYLRIAVDQTYIYIVTARDSVPHIQRRLKSTGALAPGGAWVGGIIEERPFPPYWAWPSAIEVDGDFIYICGTTNAPGEKQIYAEKRNKTTGNLVTTFNAGGAIPGRIRFDNYFNSPPYGDTAGGMALDDDFLYIVGWSKRSNTMGDYIWVLWKVKKDNAEEVWNWPNDDRIWGKAYEIAVDGSTIYPFGWIYHRLGVDNCEVYGLNCFYWHWYAERRDKEIGYDTGLRVRQANTAAWNTVMNETGEIDAGGGVPIAVEKEDTVTSPLRFRKNNKIWGVVLVDPGHRDDSGVRISIKDPDGPGTIVKALRRARPAPPRAE
ncbi:MAG: hypothetical protein ABH843_05080 [Candidatus Omnitrophota bacterium]